jgi:hypothetical protein
MARDIGGSWVASAIAVLLCFAQVAHLLRGGFTVHDEPTTPVDLARLDAS